MGSRCQLHIRSLPRLPRRHPPTHHHLEPFAPPCGLLRPHGDGGYAPTETGCSRRHYLHKTLGSVVTPCPRAEEFIWYHERTTEYRGRGIRTSLRRRSSKLRLSGVILLLAAADDGWDAWNRCSPPYFGKRGVAWDCFVHDFGAADTGYEARSLTAMISSLRQNAGAICGHPPRVR